MGIVATPLERFATEARRMPLTAHRGFRAAPRRAIRSERMSPWNRKRERPIDGSAGAPSLVAKRRHGNETVDARRRTPKHA